MEPASEANNLNMLDDSSEVVNQHDALAERKAPETKISIT